MIKELNMLDALGMIEDYCHLLIERVLFIQKNKSVHQVSLILRSFPI